MIFFMVDSIKRSKVCSCHAKPQFQNPSVFCWCSSALNCVKEFNEKAIDLTRFKEKFLNKEPQCRKNTRWQRVKDEKPIQQQWRKSEKKQPETASTEDGGDDLPARLPGAYTQAGLVNSATGAAAALTGWAVSSLSEMVCLICFRWNWWLTNIYRSVCPCGHANDGLEYYRRTNIGTKHQWAGQFSACVICFSLRKSI